MLRITVPTVTVKKWINSWQLTTAVAGALVATISFSGTIQAQEPVREGRGYTDTPMIPGQTWKVHDKYRPRPPVVKAAAEYGQPPEDAVVLFKGEDLSQWKQAGSDSEATWIVKDGYFEAAKGKGAIETRDEFGDIQLHLEWASPSEVKGAEQGRGNSGVILMGRYEIQVLDSWRTIPTPMDKLRRFMANIRRKSMLHENRANGRRMTLFLKHLGLKMEA